jgi:PKD repeat protein
MKLQVKFDRGMARIAKDRQTVVCRDRARSVIAPIVATSLLLAFAAPPSPAARSRGVTLGPALHAELVTARTTAPSLPLETRVPPLRVRDPHAYNAGKAGAERDYLAWRRRHPSAGSGTRQRGSLGTATPFTPSPHAALFEELNSPGIGAGGSFTEATPPDTTGSIGPSNYVELVNSQIAVYNRALGLQATESENEFTGGSSTCDGQIRWDQQGGRWEYASLNCNEPSTEQSFEFGWSKTADPTNLATGWCRYRVKTEEFLVDYPKLGGDNNFLIIGANEFAMAKEGQYVGSSVVVIPKPAPGESTCASSLALGLFAVPVFTPVPANLYGSSTTGYVVAAQTPEPTGKELTLFSLTKSPTGEPELAGHSIPVSSYSLPSPVPQPGTTDELDSSDTRLTQAVAAEDPARHEMAVWTQHTVAATPGEPSVVRWYELTAGSSVPVQQGTVAASGGAFAFNGAISPTAAGNGAVIDYNAGGQELVAQLSAQSRGSSTPAGEMHGEVELAESVAIDHDFSCPSAGFLLSASCRWGDYAGASPDPDHIGVVWGGGQVDGPLATTEFGPQWRTEDFALTVHAPPTASFSVVSAAPTAATQFGFDGSGSSDPDGTIASYEWSFGDGTVANGEKPVHTYALPGSYTVKLTVTDDAGFTASKERNVTVADAPPVASFVTTTASPTATAPVSFDGSSSSDPDGTIASYEWSFGDGSSATGGPGLTHTYTVPGQYTVTLTVTDNGGKTASASHSVTVVPAPTPAPTPTPTIVTEQSKGTPRVAPPSNTIRLIHTKQNKKTGSVALSVQAPGPGVLSARDASGVHASRGMLASFARALGPFAAPDALLAKAGGKSARPQALVKAVSLSVFQGGTVTLQIVPTPAGQKLLNRKHRLAVKVLFSFAPTGGTVGTTTVTVLLSMPAKRRHK